MSYNMEFGVLLPQQKEKSYLPRLGPKTSSLGGYTSYVFTR